MVLRIKQFFNKLFPYDKLAHFTFVGVLPSLALLNFGNWWVTLLVIIAAAVAIEVRDLKSEKGTAEWMDIAYAIIGYLAVIGLSNLQIIYKL